MISVGSSVTLLVKLQISCICWPSQSSFFLVMSHPRGPFRLCTRGSWRSASHLFFLTTASLQHGPFHTDFHRHHYVGTATASDTLYGYTVHKTDETIQARSSHSSCNYKFFLNSPHCSEPTPPPKSFYHRWFVLFLLFFMVACFIFTKLYTVFYLNILPLLTFPMAVRFLFSRF